MVSAVMRSTFDRLDTDRSRALGSPRSAVHPRRVRIAVVLAVVTLALGLAGACGGPRPLARPTTGTIAGLARDRDSGDPIAKAQIHVRASGQMKPWSAVSSDRGLYDVDRLAPGRYSLSAAFAGQSVDVVNIDVRAGETTMVDLVFTLGQPEPIKIDYAAPEVSEIDRYRPRGLADTISVIEGTVNDTGTRRRVVGAVVTAVGADITQTQQTISDDQGRFRFDAIPPGTYSVSAYYSIGGRGQIEVRRSGIDVAGAEAVIVPLWIEMSR